MGSTERDEAQRLADRAPSLLARLQVLTAALAGALSERDVASALVEQSVEALGAAAGVVAIDDGDVSLRIAGSLGYADELMDRWRTIPADAPIPIVESIRTREPVYILSLEERDRRYPILAGEQADNRAFLVVPLLIGARALGALALSFREPTTLLEVDKTFIQAVAQQGAVALERARLYDAELNARRESERSRFQRVLLESQSEATIDGILAVSPEGQILFTNKRFAEMWGLSDDVIATGTDDAAIAAVIDRLEDPDGFLARVRWLYENPDESSRDEVRLKDGRIFDRWSAPLVTEDVTYGRAWYFRDVTAERRLEERLALEERRSTLLADISALVAGARDERTLFDELAARVVPFLADWCIVDLAQPDGTFDRVSVAHREPAMVELASRVLIHRHYKVDPAAERGVPKVLRTGKRDYALEIPESWSDLVSTDDPEYLEVLTSLGFRAYISVPLTARGRVLGALTMITAESGRSYTHAEVSLAEEIGRRTSIALENLRLLSERSSTARSLQESLLPPHLPQIPGVALAARYRAAGDGNEVGGDFYDVFPAASGGWALVIGDVCGKGPEAAALTALVRYTIRTLSMQVRKPRRILARLNDAILSQRSDGRFCTLAYGRLDVDAEGAVSVKLSSGGHPLPIVVRASGDVRTLGRTGTLLGVFPDASSPETTVRLDPGDAVVFYTDGVTEARSATDTFGEKRLVDLLASCPGAEATVIAHLVDQAVRDFQAGDQRDDMAVLVVQAVHAG